MSLNHLSGPLWLSHCQGRYFLVRDVAEKMDLLGTLRRCGAPNFRQVRGGLAVFGMGQPSLSGFRQALQKLQKDGHKVSTTTSQAGLAPQVWGKGPLKETALRAWRVLGHMTGSAAGDLGQALPGLKYQGGLCGQHGWKFRANVTVLSCVDTGASRLEVPQTPHSENLGGSEEGNRMIGGAIRREPLGDDHS